MMDELEMINRFRAAEPGPSEAVQRRARRSLAQAIAAESKRPARPRRWRRAVHPRSLVLSVGGAAVTVATLILVFGSSSAGPASAAAAVLDRLAQVVASQSFTPHRGQYLYVESVSNNSEFEGTCQVVRPDHRQIWIGANGSGLLRESFGRASFTSAQDRSRCGKLGGPPSSRVTSPVGPSNLWFAPHCFTLGPTSDWRSLSSNPRVLLRQMRRIDGGSPTHAEDFVHVGDFLRETDAPARVRAAIYRAAALIPGIRLLGRVRDHYGGTGLGIAYAAHGSTSELIFNSRTGELLGEQSTGQIKSWSVYLHERVVNRLPGRPPAPLKPPCIRTVGRIRHTKHGDIEVGTGTGLIGPGSPVLSALSVLQAGQLGPSLARRLAPALSTRHVYLHQLAGIPRILSFWASWCSACRQDARLLDRAWRSEGRREGILFVGVDTRDTTAHAASFIRRYRLGYLELYDRFGIAGRAGDTIFINAHGKVIDRVTGTVTSERLARGIRALAHAKPG